MLHIWPSYLCRSLSGHFLYGTKIYIWNEVDQKCITVYQIYDEKYV